MTARTLETTAPPQRRGFRFAPSMLVWPAVIYLILTTQAPFLMTVYYSFFRWNIQIPGARPFVGFDNYAGLLTDANNLSVLANTLVLTVGTLIATVVLGAGLALLLHRPFPGRPLMRTLLMSSFLVMPVVTAVVWKNLLFNPVFGFFSWISQSLHLAPVDYLAQYPMASIITMVAWEWTPFAMLILLTSLQSLPDDQIEAARLDGVTPFQEFRYIVLPFWRQALEVVILLETIAFLQVYGEIYASTSGGPGIATTNLPFFIYQKGLVEFNVGVASAAGVIAVILTNILAVFLLRMISNNTASGGHS